MWFCGVPLRLAPKCPALQPAALPCSQSTVLTNSPPCLAEVTCCTSNHCISHSFLYHLYSCCPRASPAATTSDKHLSLWVQLPLFHPEGGEASAALGSFAPLIVHLGARPAAQPWDNRSQDSQGRRGEVCISFCSDRRFLTGVGPPPAQPAMSLQKMALASQDSPLRAASCSPVDV